LITVVHFEECFAKGTVLANHPSGMTLADHVPKASVETGPSESQLSDARPD